MNQMNWCNGSLEPNGLVVRAESDRSPTQVAISEKGRAQGLPLAGLLLDFSEVYEIPLNAVFGGTASRYGLRSPLIRYRLIGKLLTHSKGTTLQALVESSGAAAQPIIQKHLRKLSVAGLVEYNDWDEGVNQTRYRLVDRGYEPQSRATPWLAQAVKRLRQTETVTIDEFVAHYRSKLPRETSGLSRDQISRQTVSKLFHLVKRGVVDKPEGRSANQTVPVRLTKEQAEMWTDLIGRLKSFRLQEPEALDQYGQLAYDLLRYPGHVASLLNRSAEASALARTDTKKDLSTAVLSVLVTSGPLNMRNLVAEVSRQQGRTYSGWGIASVARELAGQGVVEVTEDRVLSYAAK
jgi:hypothetical protein